MFACVSDTAVIKYVPVEGAGNLVMGVAVAIGVGVVILACGGVLYILWKLRQMCK